MAFDRMQVSRRKAGEVPITTHDHLANHARQPHLLAVLRAVDAGHAVGMQLADFRRDNYPAAATEHLDVFTATAFEQIHHVLEVLDMPSLVGADGNALRVFLQGGGDHFIDAAVVAQVNHLGAHALQNPPHDVDGRVVAVEQ